MAEFRPIDWSSSAGTGWFTTAYSGNLKNAGTAMFYGRSFTSAGWLAVFKNTNSTTATITHIKGYIGSRQANVEAKVMCKPLGSSYKSTTSSISIESKYTTTIGKIPKENTLSTITSVKLNNPIEVKSGEYFCVGILGTSIPSGSYFNMALRRLTSVVNNVFYAQDSDTSKTVTWYRSGNANDNTNWKKHYAYIWAEGDVAPEVVETPPVEQPKPPTPVETSISISVSSTSVEIPQGSSTTVKVTPGIVRKDDDKNSLSLPNWEVVSYDSNNFTVTKDNNSLKIESKIYSANALSTTIRLKATSANGTGRTATCNVSVKATAPTINTFTVTKPTLRPTETSIISCTYSDNAGGVKYSLQEVKDNNVLVASLNDSVISAGNRTTLGDKIVVLTATTVNGGVTKSISLTCTNWSNSTLQVGLSSNVLYTDTLFDDSSDVISVYNESLHGLKADYKLTKNTILSFSNTVKTDDTKSNISTVDKNIKLYSVGNAIANSSDELVACLSCDKAVTKSFQITLKAPPTADINYPIGITASGTPTITLPAIARKNGSKWNVYYSTYPLQINITNQNESKVRVTLTADKGPAMKLGSIFDGNILSGPYWIRSECAPVEYTSLPVSKDYTITYILKADHQDFSGNWTNFLNKTYKIKYKIYDELSDVISVNDQGQQMSATKAETTLGLARSILNQYTNVNIPTIVKDTHIVDSKNGLHTALTGLSDLIDNINRNSASLIIMPQHRTTIATGQYIMADDSVATLADGSGNPIKDYYKNLNNPTGSPFREIVKAVYNLTGPIEHYNIVHTKNNTIYNVTYTSGTTKYTLQL